MMRRIILSVIGALLLTVSTAQPAHAATTDPTWYVCASEARLYAEPSTTSGIVGYLPPNVQFSGRQQGSMVELTSGARAGTYASATGLCRTSSTGVGPMWTERADRYIDRAMQLDDGKQRPDFYSRVAQAVATVSPQGWFDPMAQQYLQRLLATEYGSGGFGIGYEWDAFQDGSVNPADTAYTVTMVTHAGDALLAAFDAGALPDQGVVQRVVDRVQSVSMVQGQPGCIAYSEAPGDAKPGYCIHNVNAAAAVFLIQAADRGFSVDTPRAYRMLMQEVGALKGGQWLYQTGNPRKRNDPDHASYQLKSVSQILPELTQPIIDRQMSTTFTYRSAEAHTVLAQLACAASARWSAEHDAAAAGYWSNPDRIAYFAMEAADAAVACS